MKKTFITITLLLLIFSIITAISTNTDDKYKVVKIESALNFYVDTNRNLLADKNELIQFNKIETKADYLTYSESEKLKYLATLEATRLLLNKKVQIKDNKIILKDKTDYITTLTNNGFIPTKDNKEIVRKNIETSNKLDLVAYHPITKKFHKIDCKYIKSSSITHTLPHKELSKEATPCKYCITQQTQEAKTTKIFHPKYTTDNITLFMTDFTKYNLPSQGCNTDLCKSLLNEINNAKNTIDFAIYGISKQPEITNALINAQNKGIKIRWVYDTQENGNTIYQDTLTLKNILTNTKADTETINKALPYEKAIQDSIMHNKFFIFDKQKVWTGSANISNTDISGFNANSAVLINSKIIAELYTKEFEQMYNGHFHQIKKSNDFKNQESNISVYFSPQDKIIDEKIIPLINKAKSYIYIPVFVITHKNFNTALINAHKRGVEIKIIIDATSASSKYSSIKYLRNNGIPIKTENRAGKMHMKSIVIDDYYTIIGSMNFSKSGQNYNDENVVIIKNTKIAKVFKNNFLYLYDKIPNTWLHKNPQAESLNSINSCYDGIDNDFDGEIDSKDSSCKPNQPIYH